MKINRLNDLLPMTAAALLLSVAIPAQASLNIKFVESAPKDWFSITNKSTCLIDDLQVEIDLANSAGKLIFDTTASGAGVEVFQPFEVREGNIKLTSGSSVKDGDKLLSVSVQNLQPGKSASFTIDVDDTLVNSKLGMIRVTHSEISGSDITIKFGNGATATGKLDKKGQLNLAEPNCV